MSIGRFYGGIGALIRRRPDNAYLLLKRSETKDFAAGVWECVTGRVDQGEGFEEAVRREVREELGVEVLIDFIIGTTHFYRGRPHPENELIGVVYACSLEDPEKVTISPEHSELRWVTLDEARQLLSAADPSTKWVRRVIEQAEAMRRLLPSSLIALNHRQGLELG